MQVSIVIPTYMEAGSIDTLLPLLDAELGDYTREYLIVDDNSSDGTPRLAEASSPHCRAIVRTEERGLATAVVRGFQEAKGELVLVMDADHQHPPEAVRRMIEKAFDTGADVVIGSRHIEGGTDDSFSFVRKLVSRGASLMAQIALPPVRQHGITDPMTGLFLVRRDKLNPEVLKPQGYKILLEVLGRNPVEKVAEVGYEFGHRAAGESKLGGGVIVSYLVHLVQLAIAHPENQRIAKFGLVGLSGMIVNLGMLAILEATTPWHYLLNAAIAIEISILSNFLLNDLFTFRDQRTGHHLERLARFNIVSLLALVVNLGVLAILHGQLGVPLLLAEAIAIVVAFGANYLGNLHWTYGKFRPTKQQIAVIPFLLLLLATGFTLKVDLDQPQALVFDEGYYVTVAKQMQDGVRFDPCWDDDRPLNYEHPPLAKLIIWGSVNLLDDHVGAFEGCRAPNDTQNGGKARYEAYKEDLKENANALSWRLPGAVLAWASVLFIGLAARNLFGGWSAATLAGSLVALDGMLLWAARTAMLDVYAMGFTAIAVFMATLPNWKGTWGSILFLSMGFASKYPAAFAGPAILALHLYRLHGAGRFDRRRVFDTVVLYAFVPLVVLTLTYLPWLIAWTPEYGVAGALGQMVHFLGLALAYGTVGTAPHPDTSRPWEWFVMTKPVWEYRVTYHDDNSRESLYAIGNWFLWILGAGAGLGSIVYGAIRRRWQWIIMGALPLTTWAGFLLAREDAFVFYMALVTPLWALPSAQVLTSYWRTHRVDAKLVVPIVLLGALFVFVWYLPVLYGWHISEAYEETVLTLLPWTDP